MRDSSSSVQGASTLRAEANVDTRERRGSAGALDGSELLTLAHNAEFEALGLLMRKAGVAPERVESMIGKIIADRLGDLCDARCVRERYALNSTLGDGLEALRVDQDSALKALSLKMSIFRNDAAAYRFAFVAAARRTNWLIAAVIFLQIALLALGSFVAIEANRAEREAAASSPPADQTDDWGTAYSG